MTKRPNPGGLPYGLGSMNLRHGNFWLVYRGAEGKQVQENSHTADPAAARLLLCERTISVLESRIATVREVMRETAEGQADPREEPARVRGEHRAVERAVRKAAPNRRSDRTRKAGRK